MEAGAALVRMPPMPEPVCLPRVLVWAELSINRQKIQRGVMREGCYGVTYD